MWWRSLPTERTRRCRGSTAGWARSFSTLPRALPEQPRESVGREEAMGPLHEPRRRHPVQSCGRLAAMA